MRIQNRFEDSLKRPKIEITLWVEGDDSERVQKAYDAIKKVIEANCIE